MCGIAGIFHNGSLVQSSPELVTKMVGAIKHRGPDEQGFFHDARISLGHARLSIIDLTGGLQPIANEDTSLQVIFNGEIYNYIELRQDLLHKGHIFTTSSDTEVLVHLYEEYGTEFTEKLNGCFAIALWDSRQHQLILSRDRMGIRPLYYTRTGDSFAFASEPRALFELPWLHKQFDWQGIEQLCTLWSTIAPRTVFKDVQELAPATTLIVTPHSVCQTRYWELPLCPARSASFSAVELRGYSQRCRELLDDAVQLRLRADVEVATYLSGGLDSAIITHLAGEKSKKLHSFSVGFEDSQFDESAFQQLAQSHFGTDHHHLSISRATLQRCFSRALYHAQSPLLRTAPVPMYLLAQQVQQHGIKVVLTGEGADEVFGGYNIFKEMLLRQFWSKQPQSNLRPQLLKRLYPYISRRAGAFWEKFFQKHLHDTQNPWYSHLHRWEQGAYISSFLSPEIRSTFDPEQNIFEPLSQMLGTQWLSADPLSRAQYLEMKLFLPGYLISLQGDRMSMAHGVEGRYPFLDHRVVSFGLSVPPQYRIFGMNEKYLLKKSFSSALPGAIINRSKQPYRAPGIRKMRHEDQTNYFENQRVQKLCAKPTQTEREVMALNFIQSLSIIERQ